VLGGTYRQIGEYEKALEHFAQAVEKEPNDETLRLSIAGIYLLQQKVAEANKLVDQALEIEPECAQAYLVRGRILATQGKDEESLALCRKAIEMDPGSAGPTAYNQMGFQHLYAGRVDEAREAFENTLRIDALNGSAHDGLANILNLEGKEDAAIAELGVALQYDPNQPRALSTLASLLSQRGAQEKALALCQRALDVAPKYGAAHSNLGLIYRRMNKLGLAEEHYLKAIEYEPRLDAAYINLAQLYVRQEKTEEALEQFRKAVRTNLRNPNPIALVNLGVYHFNEKEVHKALALYRRALAVDPDYALAHKYVGSIYVLPEFDRPDLAAHHLRRSLELDPRQAEVHELRKLAAAVEQEVARRAGMPDEPASDDGDPRGAGEKR
jgi:protein O-GlcNAc transferase